MWTYSIIIHFKCLLRWAVNIHYNIIQLQYSNLFKYITVLRQSSIQYITVTTNYPVVYFVVYI